jgi:hypothetical protein
VEAAVEARVVGRVRQAEAVERRVVFDRMAAGLGLAVFAVAFRPWWFVRSRSALWQDGRETNVVFTTYERTAWQMSTRWSAAVLLVAAATVALVVMLMLRRAVPATGRILLLGVLVVAIGLTIAQWRGVEHWPPPNAVASASISVGHVDERRDFEQELFDAWAERDNLRSIHETGLTADVAEGMWVGLAAMFLMAVALVAGPFTRPRRSTAAAEPVDPSSGL